MLIIHHNDMDGRSSAAIVYKKYNIYETIRFVEMDYAKQLDLSIIQKDEKVVIVDFSLKPDVMNKLLDITKNVTWIDHHATAELYPYQHLNGLRDFKDKSKSGCELTWEYFYPNVKMPMAIQLIGDLDKWALKYGTHSFQFFEGIKLYDNTPTSNIWFPLLLDDAEFCNKITEEGKISIRYRNSYCKDLINTYGYEAEIEYCEEDEITKKVKGFACNQFMFGSKGFLEKYDDYPLCFSYIHDGENFTVSMYSNTIDVSVIAKYYGGGGHRGAAGFICKQLPFKKIIKEKI